MSWGNLHEEVLGEFAAFEEEQTERRRAICYAYWLRKLERLRAARKCEAYLAKERVRHSSPKCREQERVRRQRPEHKLRWAAYIRGYHARHREEINARRRENYRKNKGERKSG